MKAIVLGAGRMPIGSFLGAFRDVAAADLRSSYVPTELSSHHRWARKRP